MHSRSLNLLVCVKPVHEFSKRLLKSLIYVLVSFKSINGTNQVFSLLYLQMTPSDWYRVKYPHSLSLLPAAAS